MPLLEIQSKDQNKKSSNASPINLTAEQINLEIKTPTHIKPNSKIVKSIKKAVLSNPQAQSEISVPKKQNPNVEINVELMDASPSIVS